MIANHDSVDHEMEAADEIDAAFAKAIQKGEWVSITQSAEIINRHTQALHNEIANLTQFLTESVHKAEELRVKLEHATRPK